MLVGDDLPELGADLVAALACMRGWVGGWVGEVRWRKEGRESLLLAAAPPAGAPGLCEGEGEVGGWVRVPLSLPQPQSPEVVRRTTKEANEQPLLFSSRSTALSPLPHTHVARGRHISCAAASWRCRGRGGVGGWVGGWVDFSSSAQPPKEDVVLLPSVLSRFTFLQYVPAWTWTISRMVG